MRGITRQKRRRIGRVYNRVGATVEQEEARSAGCDLRRDQVSLLTVADDLNGCGARSNFKGHLEINLAVRYEIQWRGYVVHQHLGAIDIRRQRGNTRSEERRVGKECRS